MNKKIIIRCFLLVLIIINVIVFLPSFFHIAKSDHLPYLIETANINNLSDLVLYSFSYPRTRLLLSGDCILFRPLFYFLLSLQRYFFQYNFIYWQIMGFLLHLTVVGLLIKLLMKIHRDQFMSIVFGLFFSLSYLSAEAVIWHHINLNMICYICILLSLFSLYRFTDQGEERPKALWPIIIYLTVASMTNEFGLIASVLFMAAMFIFKKINPKIKVNLLLMLIPIAIYIYLSLTDYLLRFPADQLFGTIRAVSTVPNLWNMAGHFIFILLLVMILPFLPSFFLIVSSERNYVVFYLGKGFLDFFNQYKNIIFVNLLLLSIIMIFIVFLVKNDRRIYAIFRDQLIENKQSFLGVMLLANVILFLGYVFVFVCFRETGTSVGYLFSSLYHFYPLCLFLTIINYCLFSIIDRSALSSKVLFKRLIVLILCLGSLLNGIKLYQLNITGKRLYSPWGTYVMQVEDFINKHKDEKDFSIDFGYRQQLRPIMIRIKDPQDGNNIIGNLSDYLFVKYINRENPKYYLSYSNEQGLTVIENTNRK